MELAPGCVHTHRKYSSLTLCNRDGRKMPEGEAKEAMAERLGVETLLDGEGLQESTCRGQTDVSAH